MSEGIIRNIISALAIIGSLGYGGLQFYSDFRKLQDQVLDLRTTVNAIYCKLEPTSVGCKH